MFGEEERRDYRGEGEGVNNSLEDSQEASSSRRSIDVHDAAISRYSIARVNSQLFAVYLIIISHRAHREYNVPLSRHLVRRTHDY